MFHSAKSKLEDALVNLDAMRAARDAVNFKAAFNSFLSNCRSVTYALQKEGAKVHGFEAWYGPKQAEMKADELLRFIHESRTEDFHEGAHRLRFATHIRSLSSEAVGPPPHPEASLIIGAEGPFWLVHQGTSKERRIPITAGSNHVIQIAVENPPKMHRGQAIAEANPVSLCSAALDYMGELIHEARSNFEKSA